MSGGITGFLRSQVLVRLPEPTDSYTGKTVIVTGSNTGLGKEAAQHFTRLGASTVILAVRSLRKGNTAKEDIEKVTGVRDVIQVWELDMASYQSVVKFATKAETELDRLDIVLLNAGVARGRYEVFENNEATITVNVTSTFLLAVLLLPKLETSANQFQTRSNLTVVASGVHFFAKFVEREAHPGGIFDRLKQQIDDSEMEERYQVSKLMDILCTRALCERKPVTETPVTINCVCPGLCKSELSREAGWGIAIQQALFARTTECGSRTLVHAASQGPDTHGKFMADCQISDPSPFVLSKDGAATQDRVWEELSAILEGIRPGILQNL